MASKTDLPEADWVLAEPAKTHWLVLEEPETHWSVLEAAQRHHWHPLWVLAVAAKTDSEP